jgi:hypothetical protein
MRKIPEFWQGVLLGFPLGVMFFALLIVVFMEFILNV